MIKINKEFNLDVDKYPELEMLLDHSQAIVVNANDFFEYATADSVTIDIVDLNWILPIIKKYGIHGIHAAVAYIRKEAPLPQIQTEKYLKAYQELIDLAPTIWSEEYNEH